ncbi:MAG TPA: hypothetical protein VHD35_17990 [Chitinophagaceae bacterium]|nr:hypothetical protein [Chitinophagaceae bacterium]
MKGPLYKLIFTGSLLVVFGITVQAQDTTKKRSVNITSTFKPVLKEAAKINFNANPPAADTSKPNLKYDIPDQNLLFGYQPGSLKPLALQIDSGGRWDNSNYIKAGFGSLKTPYIQTGFSFGDGKTGGLNIYAKHVSSEGARDFQKFSNTDIKLDGFFQTQKHIEWDASLETKQGGTYKYGYEPETLSFPRDSLKQNFQTYAGTVGFHNLNPTPFGLSYSPLLKINVFTDNLKNTESNTVLDLPLQKTIGKVFGVNLGLNFDLTRLSPRGKSAINNTMYSIAPSLLFKTPNLNLQAGIRPSWDNKVFKMFPNIMADVGTDDSRFTFQAGWTGYVRKTTYQYLASQNPWLWLPSSFKNTWIEERYAGFKGSAGDHFSYSAKVGFNKLNNQPLFVNDTTPGLGGKSFVVVNEPQIKVLTLSGEMGFTFQEKFSLTSSLNFNQYTGLKVNKAAWGLLPVEFNTSLRLEAIKDLWFKADLFAWSGPKYMKQDGGVGELDGAFDLNAGLEFKISKYINLWTQFNNIFNKQYQRWNQYPVYGFNFTGGVVFSFNQKN